MNDKALTEPMIWALRNAARAYPNFVRIPRSGRALLSRGLVDGDKNEVGQSCYRINRAGIDRLRDFNND